MPRTSTMTISVTSYTVARGNEIDGLDTLKYSISNLSSNLPTSVVLFLGHFQKRLQEVQSKVEIVVEPHPDWACIGVAFEISTLILFGKSIILVILSINGLLKTQYCNTAKITTVYSEFASRVSSR